jgi:hypothetical protein
MNERDFYEPIGEWLIENKGCQSNEFFYGYTIDTPISSEYTERRKKPDIIGVSYERADTEEPRYIFNFHIVEAKSGTEPRQLQNLMGEIQSLQHYVENGDLAADTVSYYMAVPSMNVPPDIQESAESNGIGVLSLEIRDDYVRVVEKNSPTKRNVENAGRAIPNSDYSSGNFNRKIESTPVLSKLMNPDEFFESEIRPEMEELKQERNYQRTLDYVNNDDALRAMKTVLSCLNDQEDISIIPIGNPENPKSGLSVESDGDRLLRIVPQRRNFKVFDKNDNLLFRIESENNFEISRVDDVEDLSDLEEYLRNLA